MRQVRNSPLLPIPILMKKRLNRWSSSLKYSNQRKAEAGGPPAKRGGFKARIRKDFGTFTAPTGEEGGGGGGKETGISEDRSRSTSRVLTHVHCTDVRRLCAFRRTAVMTRRWIFSWNTTTTRAARETEEPPLLLREPTIKRWQERRDGVRNVIFSLVLSGCDDVDDDWLRRAGKRLHGYAVTVVVVALNVVADATRTTTTVSQTTV